MFVFLIVLISIIGVLMTLVILLQSGSGGGLAGIAAGGATTQILGSRQAPDFLEKATWYLATGFIVLCVLTTFTIGPSDRQESVIQQQAETGQVQTPALPGNTAIPGAGVGDQGAPPAGGDDANTPDG